MITTHDDLASSEYEKRILARIPDAVPYVNDGKNKTHELKCWPEFFCPLLSGDKTFEIRKDDRRYKVGDTLHLREWQPDLDKQTGHYTGRQLRLLVTYIMRGGNRRFGVMENFVVMGVKKI